MTAGRPQQPRVALVSCDEVLAPVVQDGDLAPLREALEARAAEVSVVSWTDEVDWGAFDVAVLRSTWDYTGRLPEFLEWARRTAAVTTLRNPFAVVRWNTDKRYLADLERVGVPVVPTTFVAPGEDPDAAVSVAGSHEIVVKPTVGAGSRDALRFGAAHPDRAGAAAHVRRLHARGHTAMVQPYLAGVDVAGETALVHLGGRFSHAVRKGPILQRAGGPVEGLFAAEKISARAAAEDELAVAAAALAAVPGCVPSAGRGGGPAALLYARVDVVRDDAGGVRVLELELTEPSLFLDAADGAADRLAAAVLEPPGA